MTDEAFLRAILVDPGDPVPRLVYADWLEERGAPDSLHRAEYFRVECRLDSLPPSDRSRRKLQAQLLQLRTLVGDSWWRQLDWARVEYCVEFEYHCPQRWDTLAPTENEAVRHCSACNRDVHYCESSAEAYRRAEAGECVALDSRMARVPLELLRSRHQTGRLLGRVAPYIPHRLPLSQRGKGTAEEQDE